MAGLADLYTGILGRAPDAAGLQYWEQQLAGGMPIENIRQSFQNVASAGTDPLKPAAPAAATSAPVPTGGNAAVSGAVDYSNLGALNQQIAAKAPGYTLNTGLSLISDDPTGGYAPDLGVVTDLYRDWLGRPMDQAGYEYWMAQLRPAALGGPGQTIDDVRRAIANSPEALARNKTATPDFSWSRAVPIGPGNPAITDPNAAWAPPAYTAAQTGIDPRGSGGVLGPAPTAVATPPLPPQSLPQRPPYAAESPFSGGNVVPFPFPRPQGNYWQGNRFFVPNFSTPQPRPIPGLLPAGGATATGANNGLAEVDIGDISAGLGIPAAALVAGLNAGRPEVINAIQGLPGGATALRALGISGPAAGATATAGGATYELMANGRVRRVPTPNAANTPGFGAAFGDALSPNLFNVGGAVLAGLPDILQGDYAEGIGAGGGSYLGGAAGTAAAGAAGVTGLLGNFVLPGVGALAGSVLGKQVGKLFGPGGSVGPNAGANLAVNNGVAQWQSSGADNKGNTQYVDQFINAVAMGANEMARDKGVTLRDGGYRIAVEILKGKLSVVGPDGVKKTFEPDQAAEAYEYAVNSILRDAGGK